MHFKYYIIFFILLLSAQQVKTQKTDSLEQSLKVGHPDTNRVKAFNQLFLDYEFTDTTKALDYLRQALALSKKLNFKRGEALAYIHFGFSREDFADYDKALIYYLQSKNIYLEIGNEFGSTNCDNSIASIYNSKGMFKEALVLFKKSLNYYLKTNNEKGIAASYNNLGTAYNAMGDFKNATENYIKAIAYYEKTGYKAGIAATYCNLGVIFQSQNNWDLAISYFNKSIIICKEIGQTNYEANNYNNLGDIFEARGDLKTALMYHSKALDIRKKLGDKFGEASTMSNIGGIYTQLDSLKQALVYLNESEMIYEQLEARKYYATTILRKAQLLIKMKQFSEAEKYVKKALDIAIEIEANEVLIRGYHMASDLYEKMGNPSKGLHYSKLYILMKDSVFNVENRKTVSELEKKYQSEKKDNEIELLNKDKALSQKEMERSRLIRNSLLAGVVLVLLLLIVSIKAFLNKKKSNQMITLQKEEVEKQKHLADERRKVAESQKHIIEEKQKEILDSIHYAKRIQQAMLTSESYFDEYLNADYFIFYQPKDIVSGDFYWATAHHQKFYIATADCTGHGVPGAFMSLLNISFLNENVSEKGIVDPGQILNEQRKQIIRALNPKGTENSKDGMDCVLCAFDLKNNILEFSAANNPLWMVRGKELIEFKANKMPVGKGEDNDQDFTTQRVEMEGGDMIYTFTDGFADQFGGPKGKKYMYRQLKELLLDNHYRSLAEQKDIFAQAINDWKGDNEQVDDILLIGVKINSLE